MQCPSCNSELIKSNYGELDLDTCSTCQGIWISKDKLEQFILLHIKYYDYLPKLDTSSKNKTPLPEAIPQITEPCPQCGEPLKWFDYDLDSNIHLYRCNKCMGIWIDHSKINKLVQYNRKHSDYKIIGEEIVKNDNRMQMYLKMAKIGRILSYRRFSGPLFP